MDENQEKNLKEAIKEEVRNWIDTLRMDVAGEIDEYAEVLTADLMASLAAGRMDLTDEIREQVQALGEIYGIHMSSQGVKVLENVVGIIVRVAAAALVK